MSSDEFRALLARNRRKALIAYFTAWVDANSEDRADLIASLASLATYDGVPRIEVGSDEDLSVHYDEMVGNDQDVDEFDDEPYCRNCGAAGQRLAYDLTSAECNHYKCLDCGEAVGWPRQADDE